MRSFCIRRQLLLSVSLPVILLLATLSAAFGQEDIDRPIPELKTSLSGKLTPENRARLLLDLALDYVHKPGEDPKDLDSALSLIRDAQTINNGLDSKDIQARSYFVSANARREKGDTAGGHRDIEKSIHIYVSIRRYKELGMAYMEGALYYSAGYDSSIQDKMVYFKNALNAYRKAGLKERQGFVLKNIADLNVIVAEYAEALSQLKEALSIYLDIHYKDLQGVYDLLGHVSTSMGDFPNAVHYGLLAVKTAQAVNDTSMQLCTICNRLANAYESWSRDKEAMEYRQKAMNIALKYHNTDAIIVILPRYTALLDRQNKWREALRLIREIDHTVTINKTQRVWMLASYINAWLAGKDYKEANRYSQALIAHIRGYSVVTNLLKTSYSCLTRNFLESGQYVQAEKYARLYLDYCIKTDDTKAKIDAYLLKSRADSSLGNFRSALVNHYAYTRLTDSLLSVMKNLQFADMSIQHETDKKEADIKLQQKSIEALKSETLLQEAGLKKASLIRNIILLAALSLLIVLYTGYRFKQRHNIELEAKQREINTQNEQLRRLLSQEQKLVGEKELLVKEIHHRVKNNLQIVISLLNAQSEFLDNPSALNAIRESRERMQAIAFIHQKLYQPDQNTFLDMQSYICEMVSNLANGFAEPGRIRFQLDVDPIDLDVSQAVPMGLILNEAITNAVKYAFPEGRGGVVAILLTRPDEEHIFLKISDNGQGLPAGFDYSGDKSLGIQLMRLFAEQLEGELSFCNKGGVEITLLFRPWGNIIVNKEGVASSTYMHTNHGESIDR